MKKALKAQTIVNKLSAAIATRIDALTTGGFVVSSEFKKIKELYDADGKHRASFERAVEIVKETIEFDFLLKNITKHKPSGANDTDYMQAKTIEKINRFIFSLANRDMRALDNHTRILTINAMLNGKLCSRAAFATLTSVNYDEDISEVLRERAKYTAGTGSTQLSSTKEMMRVLGLSDNPKGTKNADFEFTADAKTMFCERFEQIAALVTTVDAIDGELSSADDELSGINA